MTDGPKWC